ncbi:hypothetical protein [Andreprevotia chitinilytica]|uniref:hypothetical protein n=1 Tax=Andreprevotia chitinilytica TaxID=396808 RepID=UPI0005579938|nr:hypothetical protein [Andreprevotia chitinilytica]
MDENKKAQIIALFKQHAETPEPKPRTPRKKPAAAAMTAGGNLVNVSGDGVVVGQIIAGDVHQHYEKKISKVVVKPQPGAEHITEEQVRRLHNLKDQILELEPLGKQDPATPQRVWNALNKKMGVGAMRMIPASKFKAAEKYMHEWLGQLAAKPSVQKKAPDEITKRRITYIQTNMKKLDIEPKVRAYMLKHFNAVSLKELDLPALNRVYQYVNSIKQGLGS